MSNTPKPTDIVLHRQSHSLEIAFDDGARFDLPCELLRVYSPSAEVRGHWGQHAKLQLDKQDVNITEMRPVGAYALKIVFDDGHDSGLYDWAYLYDLGRKQDLYWNQYLQRLAEAGHVRRPPNREPTE
ncbi:MAG: DUF971 domain-containing protein [Gammaproteobacteria bacterium]|nr:DUF971 domain-containing protein [Gammaproteobacteria bacterium]